MAKRNRSHKNVKKPKPEEPKEPSFLCRLCGKKYWTLAEMQSCGAVHRRLMGLAP